MSSLRKGYDFFIVALAVIAGAMLAGVFVSIVYDVTVRVLGFQPPYWTSAVTEYALLFMTMLAAPWLVRGKGHVFVETIVGVLPSLGRYLAAKLVYILCICLCLLVAYFATLMGWDAYQRNDFDLRSIDMPTWILFAAIVAGLTLSALEFLRFLIGVDDMYSGRDPGQDGM
ncbi:MAG: C4-dicarboxylate ABC transporter permease [Rhodospirillaceae bacterium]|nr:C4-dicarboxylate ABC transporter permease [Rhodospirillaceae bacterium]